MRYNNSADLQERVDIGLSRSTDGGQTWEPMRVAMSFGEDGGLPSAQNGVGDPAILVDKKTVQSGSSLRGLMVWVMAELGLIRRMEWTKRNTAQLVLAKSDDDEENVVEAN